MRPSDMAAGGTGPDPQERNRWESLDIALDWMVHTRSDMTINHTEAPLPVSEADPTTRRAAPVGRPILLATVFVAFAIDQITKAVAVRVLSEGSATVGGLHLHLVANRGILMGLSVPVVVFVAATIGVVVVAFRSTAPSDRATALAWGLVVGGALGNVVDRMVQRTAFPPRAVVDWIASGQMTFNLADVFIVGGIALMIFASRTESRVGNASALK